MIVQTYMRRVSAMINPYSGRMVMQRWHVEPDGTIDWHGIPWPESD